MQVGAATVENRMEILQRTENKIAIRSSSSTSGYLPKENKNTNRLPLVAQLVKNPPAVRETWVLSLGWEDRLEKGKATYSGILAWRILWAIQSMGSQRVRLSDFHFH